MFNQNKIYRSLAGLGIFLVLTTNSPSVPKELEGEMFASTRSPTSQFHSQFPKIEQPIGLKLAVALAGLGLIGAELWWFMPRKK